jgi:Na+-translocating ferredoxin:NAD+ oxidoreductase RnfG subunit
LKVIFVFLLMCISIFCQSFKELTENKIKSIIPEIKKLSYKEYKIEPETKSGIENKVKQRFFRDNLYTWKIITLKNDTFYAVLDNVIGKVQPITFLCLFHSNLKVYFVEVMKYREAYGFEVKDRKFLNQFNDKNKDADFELGSDIRNIAGATISVNSMNKGVQKILLLVAKIAESYENK